MPNAQEFSELIRTGGLDFALLKPIDTQFLISFQRVEWSSLVNMLTGVVLLGISLYQMSLESRLHVSWAAALLYPVFLLCGVAILYSLMISLAATSIWLGRNQSLYNFWFYITNFSRYPMEIYRRGWGLPIWGLFTFVIPVLVVVNVPARLLALESKNWPLAAYAAFISAVCLLASRFVFSQALLSYRSASS